jgi:TonB family protein
MRMESFKAAFATICLLGLGWSLSAQNPQIAREKAEVFVLDFEDLQYPPLARHAHLQGTVIVQVRLDDKGSVTDAVAISGLRIFSLDAVTNVKKWHFEPNARKSAVIVYNFEIIDGRCNTDASLFVLQQRNVAKVIACPPNPNP